MVSFQGGLIQITGNPALICLLDTNSKGAQMFPFILSPHLSPHKPSRIPLHGFSPFFPFLLYLLPEINSRLFLVVYRYIVINFGKCSGKNNNTKTWSITGKPNVIEDLRKPSMKKWCLSHDLKDEWELAS